MNTSTLTLMILATLGAPFLAGCCECDPFDSEPRTQRIDPEPEPRPTPQPPRDEPPSVDDVDLPDWPPLGPEAELTAHVSDLDGDLRWVSFSFRHESTVEAFGADDTVTIAAQELGEGLGMMVVTAFDSRDQWASRRVENMLVDLTPPVRPEIGHRVLRGDGEGPQGNLELWVQDAWILGEVILQVGDATLYHSFPEGYPGTLGESWDSSLVFFSATELPEGHLTARVTVRDAAGNVADPATFAITVDRTPPAIVAVSPTPESIVEDGFVIEAQISEALTATQVELRLGGALLATSVGPDVRFVLHTDDFGPGRLPFELVAIDEAGLESPITPLPLFSGADSYVPPRFSNGGVEDCMAPNIFTPPTDIIGHWVAVRLTPPAAPYQLDRLRYTAIGDHDTLPCTGSSPHTLQLAVVHQDDDLFMTPEPFATHLQPPFEDSEAVFEVDLEGVVLQDGEQLLAMIQMAGTGPPTRTVCLQSCLDGADADQLWSGATVDPFQWVTLESLGVEEVVSIDVEGAGIR